MGPTGSGKATLMKIAAKHTGARDYQRALIDDVVENNAYYKSQVKKIAKHHCPAPATYSECFDDPSDATVAAFHEAYWNTREQKRCGGKTCDAHLDSKMTEWLRKGENVVFETTGARYPLWLVNKVASAPVHYEVIVAVALVRVGDLVKRTKSRLSTALSQFMSGRTRNHPAPRLPDTSEEVYLKTVAAFQKTLVDVVANGCLEVRGKRCGKHRVDRLLMYDNNDRPMTLIFDSNDDHPMSATIMKRFLKMHAQ